jgi:hypothetical protein
MSQYNELVQSAVSSIASTFKRRSLFQLQSSRSAILVDQQQQVTDTTDFDLMTWLVIKNREER